eukprot:COSAG05_NODE_5158_length_1249_cov_1.875652_1_plen_44_part_10
MTTRVVMEWAVVVRKKGVLAHMTIRQLALHAIAAVTSNPIRVHV